MERLNLLIPKRNNKGVALVSIMIAVMFISIIATAMLTISVSNYKMKSANNRSKENYYETEGELVRVSSSLRNSLNPDNSTDPESKLADIQRSGDASRYDCRNIAKLVYPAASVQGTQSDAYVLVDGDEIHFTSSTCAISKAASYDSHNNKKITIKDVEVVQTAAGTDSAFKNSVKTDIVITIHKEETAGAAAGGVGEFSMLMDSNLDATSSNFSTLCLYGNNYVAKYGNPTSWDGGYCSQLGTAINLSSDARINVVGDYNVVYGDIIIDNNSTLYVYGNLTVFGDIIIKDKGKLIVPGTLNMPTSYSLPGRTNNCKIIISDNDFNKHVFIKNGQSAIKDVPKSNFKSFCSLLNLLDNDKNNDGLVNKILKENGGKRIIDFNQNINNSSGPGLSVKDANFLYTNNTYFYGRPIGVKFNSANKYMINDDVNDALVINMGAPMLEMTKSNRNITIISKYPFKVNQVHNIILTKIGTEAFNYITAAKDINTNNVYNTASNPFNNITIQFGDGSTLNTKVGQWFEENCNQTVETMFNTVSGTGGGDPTYSSSMSFTAFSRDFD